MINIQGPGSLKKIVGICDGKAYRIPDLLFARKHLTSEKEIKHIHKLKDLFCFVSSPQIYKDKLVVSKSKGWCHAFRDPNRFLPSKPSMVLPESDFVDNSFVSYSPKKNQLQYDFFYFTLNSKDGVKYKGFELFCKSLDVLCGKHKLRGIVIVYFPNVPRHRKFLYLGKEYKKKLEHYSNYLTIYWGKMNVSQITEMMSNCRFGFFPNEVDNSPRTITESLLRNTPVLVNENIHGGWHYINENTGSLFNLKNLNEKIGCMISNSFNPREYYMANYGLEKSSRKLATFVQSIIQLDRVYSHMYFNNYEKYLLKVLNNA